MPPNPQTLACVAALPRTEARGLDVTPKTMHKMKSIGDKESAALLNVIYQVPSCPGP